MRGSGSISFVIEMLTPFVQSVYGVGCLKSSGKFIYSEMQLHLWAHLFCSLFSPCVVISL